MPTPLLRPKRFDAPSVLQAANLMREARRQRGLPLGQVPAVCLLDPDGDIVTHLERRQALTRDPTWACYHTTLWRFELGDAPCGVIGCAVGGPFAVLLAEQLFESGCELLVSITSAGQVTDVREPPYFVLLDRALRDEGTSLHYMPPSDFVELDPARCASLTDALRGSSPAVEVGAAWTTDAPYRETEDAIAHARALGILAVEMEAASLYAFAAARGKPVVAFAHITNRMAQTEGDFEKGEGDGAVESLRLLAAVERWWRARAATR